MSPPPPEPHHRVRVPLKRSETYGPTEAIVVKGGKRAYLWLPRVVGGIYAVGVADAGGRRVGVALLGRPVSPVLDDGWTLEVTRVAVEEGHPNVCSMLYGAARQVARSSGYAAVQTYTLEGEPGASLRAAGFVKVADVRAKTWPKGGGLDVPKQRWEVRFRASPGAARDELERRAILDARGRGLSVRGIARELKIPKSIVGRVVRGVPAAGGVDGEEADEADRR